MQGDTALKLDNHTHTHTQYHALLHLHRDPSVLKGEGEGGDGVIDRKDLVSGIQRPFVARQKGGYIASQTWASKCGTAMCCIHQSRPERSTRQREND